MPLVTNFIVDCHISDLSQVFSPGRVFARVNVSLVLEVTSFCAMKRSEVVKFKFKSQHWNGFQINMAMLLLKLLSKLQKWLHSVTETDEEWQQINRFSKLIEQVSQTCVSVLLGQHVA